jgi:ribosomal protein L24E
MSRRRKKSILIRQCLFFLGILLIVVTPLVGILPGPGGIFVFAAGLALILQNSEWAKRLYVKFKRRHPNKGRWADWGMRRTSARRREERSKREQDAGAGNASVSD